MYFNVVYHKLYLIMSEKKGMFDFTADYVICMFVVRLMLVCSLGGGGSYNCSSDSIGVLAQY